MTPEGRESWTEDRFRRLDDLLRGSDYRGWDPFDLVNSPILSRIPEGWWIPQVAVSKAGAIAPGWARRAMRVPGVEDPKTYSCAYFGYRFHGDDAAAAEMIERIVALAARGGGAQWGYDYTWGTRSSGVNPRLASTLVPASFSLLALLFERLRQGDDRHDGLIIEATDRLRRHHRRSGPDGLSFEYFRGAGATTHNANLLAAAALTLGGRVFGREDWLADAAQAAETSLRAVDEGGYLAYADHASGDWTDCFHHVYVIAASKLVATLNPQLGDHLQGEARERLLRYFGREFRREDGLLNHFPGRLHPIDPHNYAAVAIGSVLVPELGYGVDGARELLARVDAIAWDPGRGRYAYRVHRHRRDRRLFLRWTQAWMFAALATVGAWESVQKLLRELETSIPVAPRAPRSAATSQPRSH